MTNTREIVVQGVTITTAQPYAEGHTITAGEAKALNQVRAENIRNNLASMVKAAKSEDGSITDAALSELTTKVAEYDAAYEFTLSSAGGTRRAVDPLEKECISIAKAAISAEIKKQGKKIKNIPAETIAALIEQHKDNEKVIALAKKRLKERDALADAVSIDV